MRKNTRVIIFISGVLLLAFGMLGLKEDDKRFQISKGLDIFATLFRDVNLFYVDDVQPEKMVQDGIDAMLKKLDPYTVYYPGNEAGRIQDDDDGRIRRDRFRDRHEG